MWSKASPKTGGMAAQSLASTKAEACPVRQPAAFHGVEPELRVETHSTSLQLSLQIHRATRKRACVVKRKATLGFDLTLTAGFFSLVSEVAVTLPGVK